LRLAKTETELECARRELADAASLAARESSRRRRETETLERTIRALESRSRSGSDEQTDEMVVLEKILSTRVRFAVSGVPADLLRAVSRTNAETTGDSETPLRVCVLGTWNDWSENADDIVFLEPRELGVSNEALPDAARVEAISPDLVATLALRAGDVYEYKFAVAREKKSSSGAESTTNAVVLEWQTGPNRVLVVPVPGTGDDVDALDAPFVAANDVWSAATTEWRGGEEHSPVTARARSVRAEDSAGDFDHRLETPRETSSVAVAESSSEVANNVTLVDLQIADREVVDGVVVDGVPSDAGAKKWHPR